MALPRAGMFYIDLYRGKLQKSSYLKSEGPGFDIWYIASPKDLCQDCSNYSPEAKNGPASGLTCLQRLVWGKNFKKIFLSESARPMPLVLGM